MLLILSTYILTLGMGIITFGTIFKDIGTAGYKINNNINPNNYESNSKIDFLSKALFLTPFINILGIMRMSFSYVTNKDTILDQLERFGVITEMTPEEI